MQHPQLKTPITQSEQLPFEINWATTDTDFIDVANLRREAYGRHVPQVADEVGQIEESDKKPNVRVAIARCKSTGLLLGTMKMAHNKLGPLEIQEDVTLPANVLESGVAEATRFAVSSHVKDLSVSTALFKAFYFFSLSENLKYMVVAARRPVDRIYKRLWFEDLFPGAEWVPLSHFNGILHRVMYFDVSKAEQDWAERQHPLQPYMFTTHHPDLRALVPAARSTVEPAYS